MQSVVEAISLYVPSFPDEIRGCSSAEVSQLEAAVGRPLPAAYVEYLRYMGHGTGSLVFFDTSDFSFGTMLRLHGNRAEQGSPERFLMFGIAKDDPYYNFYLDCDTPEPQVVRFPLPETAEDFPDVIQHLDWLASSLYELVFSKAYFSFRLPRFSQRGVLAEDEQHPFRLERAESVLERMGLVRHPLSTEAVIYYERPTLVVVLSRTAGAPWVLSVAAHDRRELARTSDILTEQLRLLVAR